MKPNLKNLKNRLMANALLLSGAVALVAAAFGAGASYSSAIQQTESNERDLAAIERIVEARQANHILQCLNRGHETEVKQYLKYTFLDNVRIAESLTEDASPAAAAELKIALAQLVRDARAHPESYALAKAAAPTSPSIQIARHATRP
jgi:hypothetical protein